MSNGETIGPVTGSGSGGGGGPQTVTVMSNSVTSGPIAPAEGATNYIPPIFVAAPSGQSATLTGVYTHCRAGSITLGVTRTAIDGSGGSIPSLGTVTVSTVTEYTSASQALADGDRLEIYVSLVSGTPDNMTVGFEIAYTTVPS